MNWEIRESIPGAYFANARLVQVLSDEISGVLYIRAVVDEREEQVFIYEGMYYSQLEEQHVGIVITLASEMTQAELTEPEYAKAADRLYNECGIDDVFLKEMLKRGNHLFVHHTDQGKYLVLAKRLVL
ncbi:MAG: hypothetical protein PWQ12_1220 [Clostridiales bacterium]|nr:hypothetical protein [Clostridiales bacterium]